MPVPANRDTAAADTRQVTIKVEVVTLPGDQGRRLRDGQARIVHAILLWIQHHHPGRSGR
ncbi:hypothetical protein C1I98_35505 [Spongiactinospora gelatinilytica]|uniref:Uncharacterized protein n=1 Tax=Spongiactinospora gelatinilytica TaxID=2666298 RepID=A0A2W2EQ08_9ACTN|nr:hypothetical protein C1I98_35505 [Spongiactinospora gelatinilytica]